MQASVAKSTTSHTISQTIGFYFSLNGLTTACLDVEESPEYAAASNVNSDAYQLLKSLVELPEWMMQDEAEPELSFSPYEVCEEEYEVSEDGNVLGFSFWIYSEQRIPEATMKAFKAEVCKQYEAAAKAKGMTCTDLRAETQITEKVSSTFNLAI